MATHQEITSLIRAHVQGDGERFKGIVLAMAANADASSPRLAKTLRDLAAKEPRHHQLTALPHNVGDLLATTSVPYRLDALVLEPATRERIDRVLREQAARERLLVHGLYPMRKLLFVGPPGVGKTMTAGALAAELQIPLVRVQLHAVIKSHMGETAASLAMVFRSIASMRGVYLFDEFDALAPDRGGNGNDVGEMKRVVNSLLQFIENDDSDSVIIGATNHHGIIDRAMFRRFDDVIDFPLPTPEVARALLGDELLWTDDLDWSRVIDAAKGIGHADLVAACCRVNKDAVLEDRTFIRTSEVVDAISERRVDPARERQTSGVPTPDGCETETPAAADDDEGGRGHRGGARPPIEDARLQLRDHRDQVHHGQ